MISATSPPLKRERTKHAWKTGVEGTKPKTGTKGWRVKEKEPQMVKNLVENQKGWKRGKK